VNHTNLCHGPQLVIFESVPLLNRADAQWHCVPRAPHCLPSSQPLPILHASLVPVGAIQWIALPSSWLSADRQFVHLCVAYGTLVPRDHLGACRAPMAGSVVCKPSIPSVFGVVSRTLSHSSCVPSNCTTWVSPSNTNPSGVASVCDVERVDCRDDTPAVARRRCMVSATSETDSHRHYTDADTYVDPCDRAIVHSAYVQLSAPPSRASALFGPSDSNTELFTSESDAESIGTGYRRDESTHHATNTEMSFCHYAGRMDPVESRLRCIAVLALLELNTNRSVR